MPTQWKPVDMGLTMRSVPLQYFTTSATSSVPAGSTSDGKAIRIIPVDKPLETNEEVILPSQTVEAIINKFDDIAVGYCFCRQRRRLLGEPCGTEAPTLNCFTFGKSARHTVAQGFAQKVSKEDALKIMREAENAGLIHKAFHPGSRESSPETSICNCCKDCCDTLRLWRNGSLPMINSTFYLSVIDTEVCTGCGTCTQICPKSIITLTSQTRRITHIYRDDELFATSATEKSERTNAMISVAKDRVITAKPP